MNTVQLFPQWGNLMVGSWHVWRWQNPPSTKVESGTSKNLYINLITIRNACLPNSCNNSCTFSFNNGKIQLASVIGPVLHPGIRNSNINISFDLRLWFHTISHDYLPVLSVLFRLRTPDIHSPDQLLFYLTAIMSPRTYIAFALILYIWNSGTPNSTTLLSI